MSIEKIYPGYSTIKICWLIVCIPSNSTIVVFQGLKLNHTCHNGLTILTMIINDCQYQYHDENEMK